jgi:hypothetical protein
MLLFRRKASTIPTQIETRHYTHAKAKNFLRPAIPSDVATADYTAGKLSIYRVNASTKEKPERLAS